MNGGDMTKPFCHQVLDAAGGREFVTTSALQAQFPDKTVRQIAKALQNLQSAGLVEQASGKVRGERGIYQQAVWRILKTRAKPAPVGILRVSSVWGLASAPVPILSLPGRKFSPLGGWNDEGV